MRDLLARLNSITVLGVPAFVWGVFALVTILALVGLRIALGVGRRVVESRRGRLSPVLDYFGRLLAATRTVGLVAGAVLISLGFVDLRIQAGGGRFDLEHALLVIAWIVLYVQVGMWGASLADEALHRGFKFVNLSESAARTAFGVVRFFALMALWVSVAILILSRLGIEITPLLAGLGVGGIAVGFALQQILGDVFCSVAIVLDHPFEVGDFIASGEHLGTVEHIGVKTTRLRSLSGEQIICPNSDLLASRLRNFKRMAERRVLFRFGVLYDTPVAQLEAIPGIVREAVDAQGRTRFDRAHLASFGDSSIDYEVVYFVLTSDYNLYMDIQQGINLAIVRSFEREGIGFAFPTRTVHVAELPRIQTQLAAGSEDA